MEASKEEKIGTVVIALSIEYNKKELVTCFNSSDSQYPFLFNLLR